VVNASNGYRWGDEGIPPHDAVLYIPKEFIAGAPESIPGLEMMDPEAEAWKMQGVQLYIADADPGLHTLPSYDQVPSLTDRAGVLSLQLDAKVVMDGCASAMVDMYAGEIDAYRNPLAGNAVHVTLTVTTPSPSPELVVRRMWDQATSRIVLKDGVIEGVTVPPTVFVLNTGRDTDQNIDFFLHYCVTTWTPPYDQPPPTPGDTNGIRAATEEELLLLRDLPSGMTFGCSNSNYP
jgi:hypothetical protein